MNFFAAQERSLRNTRRLMVLMTLAVAAVVTAVTSVMVTTLWLGTESTGHPNPLAWAAANPEITVIIACATAAFIGFASLYRVVGLRQGGGRVARDLGGIRILPGDPDPLHRQLHNVVEEMAIASGVPVPEVYLLSQEAGINAFAAGFGPDDAAIAVTRGALENLRRDELQGVIAHEFSHVLNGDMRLNIWLMGPLYGILAIGLLGRLLLRGARHSRGGSRGKGGGAAAILALGAGLTVTGYVGLLAGRLIKSGISRQREYLADASAVQFTRQTKGIAGALKKIGGLSGLSVLKDNDAEEVSHMLFAAGQTSFAAFLATHPPLLKRIQALEPGFRPADFIRLNSGPPATGNANPQPGSASFAALGAGPIKATPEQVLDTIGNPDDRHIAAAHQFCSRIPPAIAQALESTDQVMLLLAALILHPAAVHRAQQLDWLEVRLGAARRALIAKLHSELLTMPGLARLPLVELALPQLKTLPASRQEYLLDLLNQLVNQDNRIALAEYALLRTLSGYLLRAARPGAGRQWRSLQNRHMRAAARTLLTVYTQHGHEDAVGAATAFAAGLAILGGAGAPASPPRDWVSAADQALLTLQHCVPKDRRILIRALLAAALCDGTISRAESELLRAFCALLECPVPPLLNAS